MTYSRSAACPDKRNPVACYETRRSMRGEDIRLTLCFHQTMDVPEYRVRTSAVFHPPADLAEGGLERSCMNRHPEDVNEFERSSADGRRCHRFTAHDMVAGGGGPDSSLRAYNIGPQRLRVREATWQFPALCVSNAFLLVGWFSEIRAICIAEVATRRRRRSCTALSVGL
jgi:hypothetical protein